MDGSREKFEIFEISRHFRTTDDILVEYKPLRCELAFAARRRHACRRLQKGIELIDDARTPRHVTDIDISFRNFTEDNNRILSLTLLRETFWRRRIAKMATYFWILYLFHSLECRAVIGTWW